MDRETRLENRRYRLREQMSQHLETAGRSTPGSNPQKQALFYAQAAYQELKWLGGGGWFL